MTKDKDFLERPPEECKEMEEGIETGVALRLLLEQKELFDLDRPTRLGTRPRQ